MALMEKLRRGMPAFVIFLILIFVGLIIFEWGDARRGSGAVQVGGQAAGLVNGQELSYSAYENQVDQWIQSQRSANPDAEVDADRIREQVWSQMVNDALIQQLADRLGIYISDEQLSEKVLYDPPDAFKQSFTDSTGTFREDLYFEYMTDPRGFLQAQQADPQTISEAVEQLAEAQESIRSNMLREEVESVLKALAVPSPGNAKQAYMDQNTKASGSMAVLMPYSIPDDQVNVTDEEAREYYDRNKAKYLQKASRQLKYVTFSFAPSTTDSAEVNQRQQNVMDALAGAPTPEAKDSVFAYYQGLYGAGQFDGSSYVGEHELSPEIKNLVADAQPGTVLGPIRLTGGNTILYFGGITDTGTAFVKAQHILIKNDSRSDEEARALAEDVLAKAKGGEDFGALAREFSEDPGSAQQGGDLPYFGEESNFVEPFKEAALAASVGSIVGPVETQFGYHIIKVNDKKRTAYKLRDMVFNPTISSQTKNRMRRDAAVFAKELRESQISIDSLASQKGYQIAESGPVESAATPVAGSPRLTSFLFNNEAGTVSDPIDLRGGDGVVVAQVTQINQAGPQKFEDVKDQIMTELRTQKKLDKLQEQAQQLKGSLSIDTSGLASSQANTDIRPFDNLTPSSPLPGVGYDYPVLAKIFTLKEGEISEPIRGDKGWYIVYLKNLERPAETDFAPEKEKFVDQDQSRRSSMMFSQWMQKAREKADIVDQRGY